LMVFEGVAVYEGTRSLDNLDVPEYSTCSVPRLDTEISAGQ